MPSEPKIDLGARLLRLTGERPVSLFNSVSAVVLVLILVLTTIDVIGRYAFNSPVRGKTEMTRILMAVMIGLAMPGAILRGHSIVVDLLDGKFRPQLACIRDIAGNLLCAFSMITLAYWIQFLASRQQRWGNVTDLLKIPTYPITYIIAALFAVSGIMFFFRVFSTLAEYQSRFHSVVDKQE